METQTGQEQIQLPQKQKLQKVKTILLFCKKEIEHIPEYVRELERLGITKQIDYKIVTEENFHEKPFGDDDEIELLGVNWGMTDLVNQVLDANPSIKWVHSFSAGVDAYMNPGMIAKADRITLTNSKGAFSESLGEFIAFAMLWFAKKG